MHESIRKCLVLVAVSAVLSGAVSGAFAVSGAQPPAIRDIRPELIAPVERELVAEFGWDAEARPSAAKVAQPVSVGTQKTFWAQTTYDDTFYEVQATCQAICPHCYVFVDDAFWTVRVHQEDVDAMAHAFDEATPADPAKGIYQIETESLGDPPDVDTDPKIYFLVLDILDGFSGQGSYVAGYFSGINEFRDAVVRPRGYRSNEIEMFYIDCDPGDPKEETTHAIIAHEFQHMIHFGADQEEQTWLNEGCSTFAELLTGYGARRPENFAKQSDDSLVDWQDALLDYEQTGMFVTYLFEHYGGVNTIAGLIADTRHGIASINNVLAPTGDAFNDVVRDWVMANYLDDAALHDGRYGYESYDLSGAYQFEDTQSHLDFPQAPVSGSVKYSAADYLRFEGSPNVGVYFSADDRNVFVLQYIKFQGGSAIEVGEVPLEANYVSTTLDDPTFDALVLVPTVLNPSGLATPYQYLFFEAAPETTLNHGIASVAPPPDAQDVCLSAALEITFIRPYDPQTVTLDVGQYPAGQMVHGDDGQTLSVPPLGSLMPDKTYTIIVQAGVRDLDGDLLVDQDYTWQFTTISAQQTVELAYDTEDYDLQLYWEHEGEGSGVRFTPPYAPARVTTAYFYLLSVEYGDAFYVRVLADDGSGAPDLGHDLLNPRLLVTAGHTGWLEIDLASHSVDVDGDFHVMFEYAASSWPYFAAENLEPLSERSWDQEYDPGSGLFTYSQVADYDYAIRAAVGPVPVAVEEAPRSDSVPTQYALDQSHPNPFNSRTEMQYAIPHSGPVSICIYNLLGQRIRTLADMVHDRGLHKVYWDGKDDNGIPASSGVYICRMRTLANTFSTRLVLLK